nr:immunoglobulin light chain junction region [Macaca mulatta]MOW05637.1 immunoglobulin light chain junction region [Macaca mulatta]MOW06906.1 immunoglobulin light chain junction region [Macaca mulatta]
DYYCQSYDSTLSAGFF